MLKASDNLALPPENGQHARLCRSMHQLTPNAPADRVSEECWGLLEKLRAEGLYPEPASLGDLEAENA